MLRITGGLLAGCLLSGGVLSLPVPRQADRSPTLAHVVAERAALLSLPQEEGVPVLGELFAGSPLLVHEVRGEYARVSLQAWMKRGGLDSGADARPPPLEAAVTATASAEDDDEFPPDAKDLPPLHDRLLARRIELEVEPVAARDDQEGGLQLHMWLAAADLRPVQLNTRDPLLVQVFEERRIAGGRVRGPLLHREWVVLGDEGARLFLPQSILDRRGNGIWVRVSVRCELEPGWTIYGSQGDLGIRE